MLITIGFFIGFAIGNIAGAIVMALAAVNSKEKEKRMRIKDAKTIAEYAIRKWMNQEGFQDGYFVLETNGDEGIITDRTGDKLKVRYNRTTHDVEVLE